MQSTTGGRIPVRRERAMPRMRNQLGSIENILEDPVSFSDAALSLRRGNRRLCLNSVQTGGGPESSQRESDEAVHVYGIVCV